MAFAGVSLIADGKLCASTKSAINSGADSGYHLLVVEGYLRTKETTPNGESIESRPFIVRGRRWTINYHTNGFDDDYEEFISVSLSLVLEDDTGPSVEVQYAFSFIDQPELRVPKHIRQSQPVCLGFHDSLDDQFEFMKKEADLPSHLGDLLLSKEGADVTFEVNGKEFAAHSWMLAARSTVFKARLFGTMNVDNATSSVVKIDDIKANVFLGLLTFIYTDGMPEFKRDNGDETDDTEQDDDTEEDDMKKDWLPQLLEAAERYGLQSLKSVCEEKLTELICKDTVADIIVMAERNRCLWLKHSCLEFVKTSTNLHTVFTADGLEQIIRTCSPSVLKELLSKFAS
ncbi:BTB/POZ and MATH domain-containing protein 2-like [Triticum dicoccoides]|uniref:BTB/POZ and MATH domain-containing protein 2-like n=1 Tax=Triticum dicoccoides TaxID=85692 RepID=UPI001891733D|nr:BTB/POZ and MATH domain-containing protein 2-like [Triticum dicoccoides]